MENKRTEKSIKNVIVAIIVQIMTLLLSFVNRTLLVKSLGVESVSLNGLFTEVIAMLALTELGVGSAIIYNLYKPLAERNIKKICQLMKLFKTAYRIIAIVIFLIGCAMIPIIHLLVNDIKYSKEYIRMVYFLFVVQTSTSYLFSYKVSLLNADQKKYVHSIIQVIVKCISTVFSALILFITHSFIAYLLVLIIFNFITNVIASIFVDNRYLYLKEDYGKLPAKEKKRVFSNIKNLFIKNVSAKVTNSTDNILISILVGTLSVGMYTNYSMIFNAIKQFSVQISGALAGSLGNLFASEESDQCIRVLNRMTFIFFMIASVLASSLYCCITPFIIAWLGNDWILKNLVVFICCLNLFIDFGKIPLWQSLEVSGLFEKDKNISIIGTVANLFVSIVFGIRWGILGIFLGTLVTYVIQIILKIYLLFKSYFESSPKHYYFKWLGYSLIAILELMISKQVCEKIVLSNNIIYFFVTAGIGMIISLTINIVLFARTQEMSYFIQLCKKLINGSSV